MRVQQLHCILLSECCFFWTSSVARTITTANRATHRRNENISTARPFAFFAISWKYKCACLYSKVKYIMWCFIYILCSKLKLIGLFELLENIFSSKMSVLKKSVTRLCFFFVFNTQIINALLLWGNFNVNICCK